MELPGYEKTVEIILALEGVSEVQTWELEQCQAFWITRSGRIFASTADSHNRMALALFDILGEYNYAYMFNELGWVRGRTHCLNKKRDYASFETRLKSVSMNQRSKMFEIMDLHEHERIDAVMDIQHSNDGRGSLQGVREIKRYLR